MHSLFSRFSPYKKPLCASMATSFTGSLAPGDVKKRDCGNEVVSAEERGTTQ